MPERHSEGQLLSDVPGRGHEGDGRQERSFSEADSETSDSKSSRAFDDGEQNGGDRPSKPGCRQHDHGLVDDCSHHGGDDKSRLVLGEKQGARDLREHVARVEQTDSRALAYVSD